MGAAEDDGDDGGDQAGLGAEAGRDPEREGEGQGDDGDGGAGQDVTPPARAQAVVVGDAWQQLTQRHQKPDRSGVHGGGTVR